MRTWSGYSFCLQMKQFSWNCVSLWALVCHSQNALVLSGSLTDWALPKTYSGFCFTWMKRDKDPLALVIKCSCTRVYFHSLEWERIIIKLSFRDLKGEWWLPSTNCAQSHRTALLYTVNNYCNHLEKIYCMQNSVNNSQRGHELSCFIVL